jgi:hypothetical protein
MRWSSSDAERLVYSLLLYLESELGVDEDHMKTVGTRVRPGRCWRLLKHC